MISRLTGTIVHADTRFLIIDVGGIGYKVYTTAGILEKNLSDTVTFWTHQAVREDALDLYGFPTKDELDFFELLITISGIGPKSALSILNVANPATIRRAVATEDPAYLSKTSGISKKNAEKIVLELKNKLVVTGDEVDAAHYYGSDSLEALVSLGYNERDAREALKKVPKDVTDTSECIKHALKILAKK
ncbi:Holliday junction branch migration protein RuvA [Candidatus Parcubacteria bacterium]|nr:Holliday junction branch migration protein RuvA [Candidatus Parcubacteria bacterium]